MGLFTFLDRVMGDSKLAPDNKALTDASRAQLTAGQNQIGTSIGDLNNLAGNFQGQIDAGGLTPELSKEFDVQKGAISDQAVADQRNFGTRISQIAQQEGGTMSTAAKAELQDQFSQGEDAAKLQSLNQLAFSKAQMAQQATSTLQDRLMQIRQTELGTGVSEEQTALQAWLGSMGIRLQRAQDIAGDVEKGFGMGMGGSSGGGSIITGGGG